MPSTEVLFALDVTCYGTALFWQPKALANHGKIIPAFLIETQK
jgi:hypothetical protein